MKKIFFSLIIVCGVASAQQVSGTVTLVQDHYKDVVRQVPHSQQVCEDVQVPVYSQQDQPSVGGMIVGGLVGNVLGGVSGVEGGKAIGTIIGGVAGAEMGKRERIEQIRTEQRCRVVTTYQSHSERVYSHSTVNFTVEGQNFSVNFQRR